MLRRKDYKRIRKWMALSLCIGFSLSGCGKQAETVTDYGTTSDTGEYTSGESIEEGTQSDTEIDQSAKSLSEQLGGNDLFAEEAFTIRNKSAMLRASYQVPDTEGLPVWKVSEVADNGGWEQMVVSNLFGDTAKELHRNIRLSLGDSLASFSIVNQLMEPANSTDDYREAEYSSWRDEDLWFVHSWEGAFHGTDYQLSISYNRETRCRMIGFGPKNYGNVVGHPECTSMSEQWGDSVINETGDGSVQNARLKALENQTKTDESGLIYEAEEFSKKTLGLNIREGSIISSTPEGYRQQRLFYQPGTDLSGDLSSVIADGYSFSLDTSVNGVEPYFGLSDDAQFTQKMNTGYYWVTDQGVMECRLTIYSEFVEELAEHARLLSFDNAVGNFISCIGDVLDLTRVNADNLTFNLNGFFYYPIINPKKENEYTYAPIWQWTISASDDRTQRLAGEIIQNAINGNIVSIEYIDPE